MKEKIPVTDLIEMADQHKWRLIAHQENIGMLSFEKPYRGCPARINIYTTTMTVATALNHPKHGKTQLYRRKVSRDFMGKIFKNPRVHTPKDREPGYRKREDRW